MQICLGGLVVDCRYGPVSSVVDSPRGALAAQPIIGRRQIVVLGV